MALEQMESRWASRVLVACAVTVTFLVARREYLGTEEPPPSVADRAVPNWQSFLSNGHRIGPENAKVTIVEFADFECPACRAFALSTLRPTMEAHSTDVALVFQHWPLSYHRFAVPAARAVECASEQGRFEPMHYLLYEKQDSLGLKSFASFASEAGVSDTGSFQRCIEGSRTFPKIELGKKAAEEMGARGTPAIIVNGNLLGRIPTKEELESLVQDELVRSSIRPTPR